MTPFNLAWGVVPGPEFGTHVARTNQRVTDGGRSVPRLAMQLAFERK